MFVLLLILLIEIPLLFYSISRSGLFPYPHGSMIYVIGCQILLALVANDMFIYEFLETYSSFSFVNEYSYTNTYLLVFFMFLFFTGPISPHKKINLTDGVKAAFNELLKSPYARVAINSLVIFIYFNLIALLLSVNFNAVWNNDIYSMMNSNLILRNINPASVFVIQFLKITSILAVCFCAYMYASKDLNYFFLTAPAAIFLWAYQLAGVSRTAVLLVGLFGFVHYIVKRSKLTMASFAIFGFLNLLICLVGRTTGQYGFGRLWENIQFTFTGDYRVSESILNIFEGIFLSSEVYDYNYKFALAYKLLSFSPFPSFIDGFDKILDANIQRISIIVPPSSILEAYAFGFPFNIIFFAAQFIIGRMTVKNLQKKPSIMAILANFLVFFGVYLEFTYPIRNVFRFFIIAAGIVYFSNRQPKRIARMAVVGAGVYENAQGERLPAAVIRRRNRLAMMRANNNE